MPVTPLAVAASRYLVKKSSGSTVTVVYSPVCSPAFDAALDAFDSALDAFDSALEAFDSALETADDAVLDAFDAVLETADAAFTTVTFCVAVLVTVLPFSV